MEKILGNPALKNVLENYLTSLDLYNLYSISVDLYPLRPKTIEKFVYDTIKIVCLESDPNIIISVTGCITDCDYILTLAGKFMDFFMTIGDHVITIERCHKREGIVAILDIGTYIEFIQYRHLRGPLSEYDQTIISLFNKGYTQMVWKRHPDYFASYWEDGKLYCFDEDRCIIAESSTSIKILNKYGVFDYNFGDRSLFLYKGLRPYAIEVCDEYIVSSFSRIQETPYNYIRIETSPEMVVQSIYYNPGYSLIAIGKFHNTTYRPRFEIAEEGVSYKQSIARDGHLVFDVEMSMVTLPETLPSESESISYLLQDRKSYMAFKVPDLGEHEGSSDDEYDTERSWDIRSEDFLCEEDEDSDN